MRRVVLLWTFPGDGRGRGKRESPARLGWHMVCWCYYSYLQKGLCAVAHQKRDSGVGISLRGMGENPRMGPTMAQINKFIGC